MKLTLASARILIVFSALILTDRFASAAPLTWTGSSGAGIAWSTPQNWSPLGPPVVGDDVRFFDLGAAVDTLTVNNIISANTTVRSLWLGQTNGFHNMLIEPGVTLTVQG